MGRNITIADEHGDMVRLVSSLVDASYRGPIMVEIGNWTMDGDVDVTHRKEDPSDGRPLNEYVSFETDDGERVTVHMKHRYGHTPKPESLRIEKDEHPVAGSREPDLIAAEQPSGGV